MSKIECLLKNSIIKYNSLAKPVKATFWLTVCSFLQKGISVITVPIFTRLLNSSEYGMVSVYVSWANIFSMITSLSVYAGAFNPAMIKYDNKRDEYVSSMLGLTTLITGLAWIVYMIFKDFFVKMTGLPVVLLNLMFVQLLFAPAFNLWLAKERFEYKYKSIVIVSIIMSILSPLVSVIAVVFSQERAMSKIISAEVVSDLIYLLIYVHLLFKGKKFLKLEYWRYVIKINIPLIPHFLSGTILNQADRVMINNFCGADCAGIYSVAYSAAMVLTVLNGSINASLVPWTYRKIKANQTQDIKGVVNTILIGVFCVISIFILCAPEMMYILASKEYGEAVWIIPSVTCSVFFWTIFGLFVNIELYYEKSIYVAVASVISALLNVLLNYVCIPKYGYMAAGYTTLASYLIYTIIHFWFMKKVLKQKNQKNDMYDVKFILVLSCFMICVSFISLLLYRNIIIRYLALFCIVSIVVYKGKDFNRIGREVRKK